MKTKLNVIVCICSLYIFFTDAQNIIIDGGNERQLTGGENARIVCKVVSGLAENENPNLKWFDKTGTEIGTDNARIYVFVSPSKTEASLLMADIMEDDAGSYNCTGIINGQKESARVVITTRMPLVIDENQVPRHQLFSNGSDANVKCDPQGNVQVMWEDKNGDGITANDDRFVISPGYLLIPNIQTTDDGFYKCIVMGDNSFESIRINVTVTVPPKIIRPPVGQSVAVGKGARFECSATAKPEPNYLWYKDDGPVELGGSRYDINQGILIIKSVIKDDAGMYKCKAFSAGKEDVKAAELRVLVPPQITRLDNSTGDEGSGAVIKCTAYGEPIPDIKWQKQDSNNDFSEGTQNDQTRITVSHLQRPDRMEVEGTLDISNLESNDAGFYICKATNEAEEVQKSAYLKVQYAPNFSKVKEDILYSWGGKVTEIRCIATSVPESQITWEKDGQLISSNGYSIRTETVGEDTTSTLSFQVDFSNINTVYGIYTCKANNGIGEVSMKNFTLKKADPPVAPSVNVRDPTPTTLILSVNIPKSYPPVNKIYISYGNIPNPIERPVSAGQSVVEVPITDLSAGTDYNFVISAESDVGKSPDYGIPIRTQAPRKPYPATIISKPYSDYPLKYSLQWSTPNSGGYPITKIHIKYAEVEVFPNKSASNEFQKKQEISGWHSLAPLNGDETTFQIRDLIPSTYYEVVVTAENIEGTSDPKPMIFVTSKDEPPTTEAPKEPSKKSQDTNNNTDDSLPLGPIIAIIVIVVIIVFIVIDVTCYVKRKCGVFMCIKEKIGRTGSMETRSKEKIIEEGDADGGKTADLANDKQQNGAQPVPMKAIKDNKNIENTKMTKEPVTNKLATVNEVNKQNDAKSPPKENNKQNGVPKTNNNASNKDPAVEPMIEGDKKADTNKEPMKNAKSKTDNNDASDTAGKDQQKPINWKKEETLDRKTVKFEPPETKEVKNKPENEAKQEKKVPLLADNKDNEGTDGDQESVEAVPSDEKEPEDKEEKPTTPEPEKKDVEEAEEVKPEDEKPASPKEESKDIQEDKKDGE